jgi:glucose/arabinose dehydrogenase
MAPMPLSSRSVYVPLAKNLHLAFDTEKLRVHTVWRGGPLKLFGPGYHGPKRPFICQPNGRRLWGNPPFLPWFFGEDNLAKAKADGRPKNARYLGLSTKGGRVTFMYELRDSKGRAVRVHESVRVERGAVVRRFEMGPRQEMVFMEAHAELGRRVWLALPRAGAIQLKNKLLLVVLRGSDAAFMKLHKVKLAYDEEVFTEEGTTKGNPRNHVEGTFACTTIAVEPGDKPVAFEVVSLPTLDEAAHEFAEVLVRTPVGPPQMDVISNKSKDASAPKPTVRAANPRARRSFVLSPYYKTEAFPLPDDMKMLVTGMDWMPKGRLALATYRGEVYIVEGATGPVAKARYRRFARGMCEPLGLLVKDGKIHLGNKNEITRLTDTDGNGEADLFESVNSDWDYTGSYNSFSYGPVLDKAGNFVVANAGHAGRWSAKYMGWALRISSDGRKLEPICSGMREPNGIGTFGPNRDIFVTENQGAWIGACKLNHIQPGRFFGHPSSKPAPEKLYSGRKTFDPPAVWFPYKLARSSTGMCEITADCFGPFKGQLLVGDFQNAIVTRVHLEKVGGEWQGAVWPFLKGFQSGVNRLVMGPDGHLYVGGCKTVAWAANAPFSQGLERVKFSGKIPFEVKTVRAMPDGFELTFTKPVDPKAAGEAAGYDVWQYKYKYQKKYGSPEFDHDGKPDSFTVIDVKSATVSEDGQKVRLRLDGWKAGFVTAVRGLDARSAEGEKLWHDTFYYTLNRIPR